MTATSSTQDLLFVTVSRSFREGMAGDELGPCPNVQEFLDGYFPPLSSR
ncbi:hypothetical protein [Sanguibacter sp. 25GB23B1]